MSTPLNSDAPPPRPVGEQLFLATMILALGDVAGKVLALIITIIRTRTLSTDEFGGYGFIISTIGMFAQVAGFSLGMAATRFIALHRDSSIQTARAISQFICLIGVVTTLVAIALLGWLAPWLVRDLPGLLEPLRWSTLIVLTQTLSGLLLGVLIGLQRYKSATLATFSQNVVMLGLTAWWAPQWGLEGAIWATAAGFLTTLLMAWWQSRALLSWPWEPWRSIWSHRHILVDFCLPTLLAGFILFPASWVATLLIARQTGSPWPLLSGMVSWGPSWLVNMGLAYHYSSGLRQVALFTAADQFRPLLFLLCNVVSQPLMPIVTSKVKQSELGETAEERNTARRQAQRAIERSFQLAACLILPIHALLAFAGPYIMAIFGRTFASEWDVFLTMLAFGAYTGIASLATHTLTALSRVWTLNLMQVIFGVLLIVITWMLQSYGALGLGLAYFIATFCSLSVTAWILHRAGYLTWFAILVQLAAFGWLLLMSLTSAFTPITWRPFCLPIAFLATVLAILLTMRTEMMQVIELVRRKLRRR